MRAKARTRIFADETDRRGWQVEEQDRGESLRRPGTSMRSARRRGASTDRRPIPGIRAPAVRAPRRKLDSPRSDPRPSALSAEIRVPAFRPRREKSARRGPGQLRDEVAESATRARRQAICGRHPRPASLTRRVTNVKHDDAPRAIDVCLYAGQSTARV